MSSPLAGRRIHALLAVALGALMLTLAPVAQATTGHKLNGGFAAPGAPVAVDQSTQKIYVPDNGASQIDVFAADGTPDTAIPIDSSTYNNMGNLAVDPAGFLYLEASNAADGSPTVLRIALSDNSITTLDTGVSGTSINGGGAVTVNPANHEVYLTANNAGTQVIDVFDGTTGAFSRSFDGSSNSPDGGFGCPSSVAWNPGGDLIIVDPCKNRVDAYGPFGAYQRTGDDGSVASPVAVAVDQASGEGYVVENGPSGTQVTDYGTDASPGRLYTFGAGTINCFGGIATDDTSGDVYVTDGCGQLNRYSAFTGATVSTDAADGITANGATLHATVNPEGQSGTTVHFDWGTDTNYGNTTPDDTSPGNDSSDHPVSADLSGQLQPNTTYHFRVVVTDDNGTVTGADQSFTTAPAPPTVDGSPAFASDMTTTGATLHGTVNPNNSQTTYHFEYGTDTSYGTSTADGDAGAGNADNNVSTAVTGLQPGTTYHFRIVADNGTGGPQQGADQVFHTAPAAPPTASDVTATTATLNGTLNPHGDATTYHFQYGTTASYGSRTPEADAGSADGDQAVDRPVTALAPDTTYHVRLVATDTVTGQTASSDDATFHTHPAPAATVGDATGLTTTAATVNGTADTHGMPGTYRFVVSSTSTPYQSATDPQALPAAAGARSVHAGLSDLPSGSGFVVRLAVTADGATTTSDPGSFATAPLPPFVPPTPASALTQGAPYGCQKPVLNTYDKHPKPGDTITLTGSDLGVGGTVAIGDGSAPSTGWTASAITVVVPDDATGTLPVTINCGTVSNTVALAMFVAPKNTFTVKAKSTRLTLRLPGAGSLTISGSSLKTTRTRVKGAGTKHVTLRLTAAASRALRRRHKLTVRAKVTFTPTGGTPKSTTLTLHLRR